MYCIYIVHVHIRVVHTCIHIVHVHVHVVHTCIHIVHVHVHVDHVPLVTQGVVVRGLRQSLLRRVGRKGGGRREAMMEDRTV